jgi:pyridoxine 4-dehydrogenase
MLTGQIKSFDDIPENDFRKLLPRFQPGNFEINLKLVKEVEKIAAKKNCTSAQLAISWLRNLSKRKGMPEIYPIPGAVSVERVKENSVLVGLNEDEMESIDSILASFKIVGERYHPPAMAHAEG